MSLSDKITDADAKRISGYAAFAVRLVVAVYLATAIVGLIASSLL